MLTANADLPTSWQAPMNLIFIQTPNEMSGFKSLKRHSISWYSGMRNESSDLIKKTLVLPTIYLHGATLSVVSSSLMLGEQTR